MQEHRQLTITVQPHWTVLRRVVLVQRCNFSALHILPTGSKYSRDTICAVCRPAWAKLCNVRWMSHLMDRARCELSCFVQFVF